MQKPTAFTLIELLVVVTIIVVLLALLTPALDKAIAEAERVVCLSNFRSIGIAMHLYTGDHKRYFPWGFDYANVGYPQTGAEPEWANARPPQALLRRYGAAPKMHRCPTDTAPLNYVWYAYKTHHDGVEWKNEGASYMFSEQGLYNVGKGYTTRSIVNPETYGYMSEGFWVVNGWSWMHVDPNDPAQDGMRLRWDHGGRVNFLFGDLRAESVDQYQKGKDVDPIRFRIRSHPFDPVLPQYGPPAPP
jgi:prepilin-type processing-associated H-X9-DG protein